MIDQPAKGAVFIPPDALKQMLAWPLLCLGIIQSKDEEFTLVIRTDGVLIETRGK